MAVWASAIGATVWMARHDFAFTAAYRAVAVPFLVSPRTSWIDVSDGALRVRFGPWRAETLVRNISSVQKTGGYSFVKTAGPAHLSLADKGVTFATNGRRGVCLQFADRVRVDAPVGHLSCPGLTVTPEDPDGFVRDLLAHGYSPQPTKSDG